MFDIFIENFTNEHKDIKLTNKEKILISKAIEFVEKTVKKNIPVFTTTSKGSEDLLSIKEASEVLYLPAGTLRQWENDFAGIIEIPRDKTGSRLYSEKELNLFKIIRDARKLNISIQQIRIELLHAKEQGDFSSALKQPLYEKYADEVEKLANENNKREQVSGKLRLELLNESARYVETEDKYIPSCKFCGITACESSMHIDHIIPVSKGGKTEKENLQVLCSQCNIQKSNKYELVINRSEAKESCVI